MYLDYQTGDHIITKEELDYQPSYLKEWKQTSNQYCTNCDSNILMVCNLNTLSTSYPDKYECRCVNCGKVSYRLRNEIKFKNS